MEYLSFMLKPPSLLTDLHQRSASAPTLFDYPTQLLTQSSNIYSSNDCLRAVPRKWTKPLLDYSMLFLLLGVEVPSIAFMRLFDLE